jgi:hypothetical protein
MPSRKIPPNRRSLTGLIASQKNPGLSLVPSPSAGTPPPKVLLRPPQTRMKGFESSLERDFLILLDFDLNVDRYEEQPLRIEYTDGDGRARTYTPDVLVYYRDDMTPAKWMKPLLCEVKYRADLFADWPAIKPKIRAGRDYAREQGWRFQIVTEREVRTPYLDNAKFLRPYRRIESPWDDKKLVLDALRELREADPETVLLAVHQDPLGRAQLLPALWHLLAMGMIDADLTLPLNMRTRIWATA